ncbi:hypothetical protein HATV-3_gp4 [Haloarcula tailed virus 3]|uniref:Uncharacterized protein n=1 Tax=Haloarcula tailed virus 3 TaxID=2877990 RepID=A0AAE8Y051_9CAUD|nr:hypothetical protein M1M35_gp04 [Haloarcula tailed virus 3]UBF23354.1 hypothetical protein HATV-3_gp4 [Haloarcula tailed virus 3]
MIYIHENETEDGTQVGEGTVITIGNYKFIIGVWKHDR